MLYETTSIVSTAVTASIFFILPGFITRRKVFDTVMHFFAPWHQHLLVNLIYYFTLTNVILGEGLSYQLTGCTILSHTLYIKDPTILIDCRFVKVWFRFAKNVECRYNNLDGRTQVWIIQGTRPQWMYSSRSTASNFFQSPTLFSLQHSTQHPHILLRMGCLGWIVCNRNNIYLNKNECIESIQQNHFNDCNRVFLVKKSLFLL